MSVVVTVAMSVRMFMFMFMNARLGGGGGGNSKMMNFGKSRAKMSRTNSVNFSNVAGLEEEKEEHEKVIVSNYLNFLLIVLIKPLITMINLN